MIAKQILFGISFLFFCSVLFYCQSPVDPFEEKNNVNVTLSIADKSDGSNWVVGDTIIIEVAVLLPYFVNPLEIEFGDGSDTTITKLKERPTTRDTLHFNHIYTTPGKKGINVFAWIGKDESKSAKKSITIEDKPTAPDTAGPTITLISPREGEVIISDSVLVQVNVTDESGVEKVIIKDFELAPRSDNIYEQKVTLTRGSNIIRILAMDMSPAKNQDTLEITLTHDPGATDITPPKVTLLFPDPGKKVTISPVELRIQASDANGIASVTVNNDNATYSEGVYRYNLTLTEGANQVTIIATDKSNSHNADTSAYTLQYDVPPAAVTLSSPQPADITPTSIQLSWTQSMEPSFGAYKVFYSTNAGVSDTNGTLGPIITDKFATKCTLSGLEPNTKYYVKVYVFDDVSATPSNEISVTTMNVNAPTIAISGPVLSTDSAVVRNASQAIKGTIQSDILIKEMTYKVNNGNPTQGNLSSNLSISVPLQPFQWNTITISVTDNRDNEANKTMYLYYQGELTIPDAPSIARICKGVEIEWHQIPQCSHYIIYRSDRATGGTNLIISHSSTSTFFTDSTMKPNEKYWYSIRGYYKKKIGSLTIEDTTIPSSIIEGTPASCFKKEFNSFTKIFGISETDNGFIVGTYSGSNRGDISLFKIDNEGNKLESELSFYGAEHDLGFNLIKTKDPTGFAVVGFTQSKGAGGIDAWLIKFYQSGQNWEKAWNTPFGSSGDELGYSVRQTNDGEFAIAGTYTASTGTQTDAWVMKTKENGRSLDWECKIGGDKFESGYDIQQSKDGNFIVTGKTTTFGSGKNDVYLTKINASTKGKDWDKWYGGSENDGGKKVFAVNDGYVIIGYTNSYGSKNAWVIKTDLQGEKQWDSTYSELVDDEDCTGTNIDGGIIIFGGKLLIKTNNNGKEIWKKTFMGHFPQTMVSSIVEETSDKGFIIGGKYGTPPFNFNIFIFKTDYKGNIETN